MMKRQEWLLSITFTFQMIALMTIYLFNIALDGIGLGSKHKT